MKNDSHEADRGSEPAKRLAAATPESAHIGQILKKRRQALRLSLTDVELATKIRGKFLVALESGDYSGLAHDIYSKGFIQAYAEFLGLNDRVIVKQYLEQRGDLPAEAIQLGRRSTRPTKRSFVITPRLVIAAAAILVALTVSAYLVWQVSTLAAPPILAVTNPTGDEVIVGSLADINGRVTLGADVFINDAPVLVDANGNFSEKIALQNGVNVVHIVAKNRLGKTRVVTRNILAKNPQPIIAATTAPATINGVMVQVTIKKAAAAITASVDGQAVFNGTMLAGTTQTFSGNQSVIITTGNAGETALTVTNQTVAGKKIDPVGADGEVKRDLEFTATTVLQ